ncbi:head-tail connector protein [Paraglaciecola sp.]|uniref:head-tail connector protein n=1 Tax=Paraglaciecola sp. TaxID=1920173 RepID=UPI003EFAE074
MITVSECKQQCSIEEGLIDFDPWFARIILAATAALQSYLNRKLFANQSDLDAAKSQLEDDDNSLDTAMVITEDLKHAMLMMIAHWFENRETASSSTIKNVPVAFQFLAGPYRSICK